MSNYAEYIEHIACMATNCILTFDHWFLLKKQTKNMRFNLKLPIPSFPPYKYHTDYIAIYKYQTVTFRKKTSIGLYGLELF